MDSRSVNNINEYSRVNRSQFNYAKTVEITVNILFPMNTARKKNSIPKQKKKTAKSAIDPASVSIKNNHPNSNKSYLGESIFRFVFPVGK